MKKQKPNPAYDRQIEEKLNIDPTGKSTSEKLKILRAYRDDQYEKLLDAVYLRRGWNNQGVPTVEHLKKIVMDLPQFLEVVNKHL